MSESFLSKYEGVIHLLESFFDLHRTTGGFGVDKGEIVNSHMRECREKAKYGGGVKHGFDEMQGLHTAQSAQKIFRFVSF